MSFYEQLKLSTAAEARAFQSIPLIRRTIDEGVSLPLYLDFLAQAYHHVRHTCPLLALALSRLQSEDAAYRAALLAYLEEEKGHEQWILADIAALGGDADTVRRGEGRLPCRTMVSHAYYLTDRVDPYGLLGMVHVLEGMSVMLATTAAQAIRARFAQSGITKATGGFSYLMSHGALDQEHVQMFAGLLDGLNDPRKQDRIVAAAIDFYQLYGAIFEDLGQPEELRHAS
ncbi:iron-containing redox enzyme family protein [Magnetospira thiophila]